MSARDDEAGRMPLGAVAAAPMGFLEMCERSPDECLSVARPSEQMLSDVRVWAGRARWASVFQAANLPIAPAAISRSPEVRPAKSSTTAQIRADKDAARKALGARPPKAAPPTPPAAGQAGPAPSPLPVVRPPAPPTAPARAVAEISIRDLETVTRRVNRAIRRSSDTAAYGREDVWILPTGPRPTGDCEDYVLAKRRALIDRGVDPAALSIAVVRTRRGEMHAVLLVATAEGELVLDNLSPWVVPWREAPYDWLQRQAPGQPLLWLQAAT